MNEPCLSALADKGHVVLPDWTVPSHVCAFTTTRAGGVSQNEYASFNLGLQVGDETVSVLSNRHRLRQGYGLPADPCWLKQTHGTQILDLDRDLVSGQGAEPADAAYTNTAGTVAVVLTADCLPVVLTNGKGTELVVVHAGWRGLAAGILARAVNRFSDRVGLSAWLGPAIGPESFEVGQDVYHAFESLVQSSERHFRPTSTKGKYLCNLYALAAAALHATGEVSVSGGGYCTHSQKDKFYSHRRDGLSSGRMATVAWLSGKADC